MKRFISLILAAALLLSLAGCGSGNSDAVSFYYCRTPDQFRYYEEDGVICAEERNLAGHRQDLRYMLGLYLSGPLSEGMEQPFPIGTALLSAQWEENSLIIELSDVKDRMTDMEFTAGCACLTLTCMSFAPCEAVVITSGERSIAMDRENLSLYDNSASAQTEIMEETK